ncbi:MAG: hypothetical protein SNJ70_11210 [Armatimonadota bacterium]
MKRNLLLLLLLFTLILPTFAFSEDSTNVPIDIPIYKDADVNLEVNLDNENILPAIKAAIAFMKDGEKVSEKIDFVTLESVIKDLKRIQLLELSIPVEKAKTDEIIVFYNEEVAKEKWTPVMKQTLPKGTFALFTKDGGESIFAYRVWEDKYESGNLSKAMVLKTEGKIDIPKLIQMAYQYFFVK